MPCKNLQDRTLLALIFLRGCFDIIRDNTWKGRRMICLLKTIISILWCVGVFYITFQTLVGV